MTTKKLLGLVLTLATACSSSTSKKSDGAGPGGFDPATSPTTDGAAPMGNDTATAPADVPVVKRTVAVTTPGEPSGPVVTATIGAAGGVLISADKRLTVTVPANAVTTDQTFSIQRLVSSAPGSMGLDYSITPSGVTFAVPVTLSYSVPESGVSRSSLEDFNIGLRLDNGHWVRLAGSVRDDVAKTVSATTLHFCETSLLEGFQLRPTLATVKEGATLQLAIFNCANPDDSLAPLVPEDPLAPLVPEDPLAPLSLPLYPCQSMADTLHSQFEWSIDGVVGGSATKGTIAASPTNGTIATYTAPATRPSPNSVMASVRLTSGLWLVSQLSIGAPGTSGTGSLKIGSTSTWNRPDGNGRWTFTGSGDYTFRINFFFNYDKCDFVYPKAFGINWSDDCWFLVANPAGPMKVDYHSEYVAIDEPTGITVGSGTGNSSGELSCTRPSLVLVAEPGGTAAKHSLRVVLGTTDVCAQDAKLSVSGQDCDYVSCSDSVAEHGFAIEGAIAGSLKIAKTNVLPCQNPPRIQSSEIDDWRFRKTARTWDLTSGVNCQDGGTTTKDDSTLSLTLAPN